MQAPLKERFYINGGKKLSGEIEIPGSKNAALPILAATLAVNGISRVTNIPDLSDTRGFMEIMKSIGAKIKQDTDNKRNFTIDARNLTGNGNVSGSYIGKMRSSIMFLAPVLARFGRVSIPFPGGCVLGKRSVDTHLNVFKALGATIIESETHIEIELNNSEKTYIGNSFVMPELSVTATENALIAMAFAKGNSNLRLAASEPHVQNLCEFLQSAGAKISGIGSHALEISGIENNQNISAEIEVTSDYLQVGTYVLAGILTNSEITVKNAEISHLDSFIERLKQTGARFEVNEKEKYIKTLIRNVNNPEENLRATDIQTGVFPKFATDLHPQFAVLLTQCQGVSKIQETLFERKFAYLLELEKMGADVEIQNPHVFKISGPTPFIGTTVASQDIRAGAAMILAALITNGETEITNIHYIHRGYENIEENLTQLGAEIRTGS